MRFVALALLVLVLGAGCSQPPSTAPTPAPVDHQPPDAVPANDTSSNARHVRDVVLLQKPIQMVGGTPITYDLTIPAGLSSLSFLVRGDATAIVSGFTVAVSDCGAFSEDGIRGNTGVGSSYGDSICEAPKAGPATVTVSSKAAVILGTFEVHGQQPA
jgi:hypothetical protein